MELHERPRRRFRVLAFLVVAAIGLSISAALWKRPAPLNTTEAGCVGSWAYLSPDHRAPTQIVYHFHNDRNVVEEHFYLSSAYPTVPRLTFRGQWHIEPDGRLVVEPRTGLSYAGDAVSEFLGESLDNGRQGWPRPVLTRFYSIKSVTDQGIEVQAGKSGGGQVELIMKPL
jgi:hypothetical protein